MRQKQAVTRMEFRGGFALVGRSELESMVAAFRDGQARKAELRVFAARAEKRALPATSRVDLSRVLNCKARQRGVKRLRRGEIERAGENVSTLTTQPQGATGRLKAVPRLFLRQVAQGRVTSVEAIVLFYYAARRITQVKPLRRLLPEERYARFTYRELSELSGISRANISRAVASLKRKGLLSTVWVVKQNENQFGLLFVDGPALSLIPGSAADRSQPVREHKKATPSAQKSNTPVINLPTLKKQDLKRDKEEIGGSVHLEKGYLQSEFERIKERARQMRALFQEQAA